MPTTTEYCPNCGVAISEPSSFCGRCGAALAEPSQPVAGPAAPAAPSALSASQAGPPPGQSAPPSGPAPTDTAPGGGEQAPKASRRWVPFAAVGGAAVLVAGLVVALLLALGGSAGKNVKSSAATREQALALLAANGTTTVSNAAPGLFALVTTGKLTTIVPAGWRATAQAAGATTRAEFADPKNPGSTMTIVAQSGGGGSDHNRAGAAERAVRRKGYKVSSYGPITFPGGREVWHVTYADSTSTHETYFYSACKGGRAAMVVDIAAPSSIFQHEQPALEAAAASAEPLC
jgi:zinc-ribbon domain